MSLLPECTSNHLKQNAFTLAMIQMEVRGGAKEANLNRARTLVAKAADHGADVVLLPECMDLGWTHPSATSMADPIPDGSVCAALQELAQKHGVYVCSGLTERDGPSVYNAAVLISPSGDLLLKHRKLNELDIAHDLYDQGDRLNVADTEFGRFGVMICADASAKDHSLTRSLGYMGADVILSPSSWAVPPDHDPAVTPYGDVWRDAYIPVAKDFQMPIFGVSNVGPLEAGPWKDWNCIGCSLAINADGEEVFQGPYCVDAETILYTEVHPRPRPARGTLWVQRNG